MNYTAHRLKNGIKTIHIHESGNVGYCGLLINAGSRDENDNEHGLAHFIEHALFKGTKKRKAFQLINRMEHVGGELNAYTTKEETFIYATFLNKYFERAIELLHDLVFNSTFPEKEIEREKEVVIEEINSYIDSPAELIFDDFEELVFSNQPMGKSILGTPESIKKFTREGLVKFMKNNYFTNEMVLCTIGNINHDKIIRFVEKYFGSIQENSGNKIRKPYRAYTAERKDVRKNTLQAHCIVGNVAYNAFDSRRTCLFLLNNILGGQSMNSRLNVLLREKHAFSYNVESNYTPYSDCGIVSTYFATDKENLEKSIQLVYKELDNLREKKLGILQLKRAKAQLLGQLAIANENKESLLISATKAFSLYGKIDSHDDIAKKIQSITTENLIEVAHDIFNKENLSILTYI